MRTNNNLMTNFMNFINQGNHYKNFIFRNIQFHIIHLKL